MGAKTTIKYLNMFGYNKYLDFTNLYPQYSLRISLRGTHIVKKKSLTINFGE
jgi:hypothetical protein